LIQLDLNFKNIKIHSEMKFPKKYKGNLTFNDSILRKQICLPNKLEETLRILRCKITGPLLLPLNPECEIIMQKGSDIKKPVAPQAKLNRFKYIEPAIRSFRLMDTDFDFHKIWFLRPHDPADSFFASLDEGAILHNKSAFKSRKSKKSKIKITDFTGICSELSEPVIFPVTVEAGSLGWKTDQNFWYASKVKLHKPQNIWDFLNASFQKIHYGTLNFSGQQVIPDQLQLPDIICGDLIFNGSLLPDDLKLPQKIEGELKIQSCEIPATWRLPDEIKKVSLTDCTFHENIHLENTNASEISILNCRHKHQLLFPVDFSGAIALAGETLSAEFDLPAAVENLSLTEVRFEKGNVLPNISSGKFMLNNIQDFRNLKLPAACEVFSFRNCKLPKKILTSINRLKELEFFKCDLPDDFIIPHQSLTRISFKWMKIPQGLNLPDDYMGKLEFTNARAEAGLRLPDHALTKTLITEPDLSDPAQDHSNDDYAYVLNSY